ncbi:hypothetical protein LX32DRAFT_244704 [Colletotrichum zoysiae]|uniref:Uncharacterized protein n=1 Tax=Colletotrichum zoysiae TaxID=1216348 RepID=A0AAD9HPJ4_9PEZI|nr:hypothetical protein LX32DRAFT_244704 [Colletotrichum zoysiae]
MRVRLKSGRRRPRPIKGISLWIWPRGERRHEHWCSRHFSPKAVGVQSSGRGSVPGNWGWPSIVRPESDSAVLCTRSSCDPAHVSWVSHPKRVGSAVLLYRVSMQSLWAQSVAFDGRQSFARVGAMCRVLYCIEYCVFPAVSLLFRTWRPREEPTALQIVPWCAMPRRRILAARKATDPVARYRRPALW